MEPNRRIQQLSEVQDPKKVKVLVLADQKASSADFYLFIRFKCIVKLDLSVNKLATFPAGFTFKSFPFMRILFLHRNRFSTIKSVQIVAECRTLQYLTFFDNQLQPTKTRHYFVNQLPALKLLDTKIVKIQQRNPQIMFNARQNIFDLTFPLAITAYGKGTTYFLSVVVAELRMIRHQYLKANPIILIQRFFRKFSNKKQKMKIKQEVKQEKRLSKYSQKLLQKKNQTKQRLISEKLQIYEHIRTNQQKILSVFLMNINFLKLLKEKSQKKIFALKSFCQQNKIQFEAPQKELYCLRTPKKSQLEINKSFFPLIVHSNSKYIIRKKGAQQSYNFNANLSELIKKRRTRQPSYYKKFKKYKLSANKQLNNKLKIISESYEDKIVLVKQRSQKKQEIMKEQYFKCVKSQCIYPFLLQQLLERAIAAVSIQRMWRGYYIRKHKINSRKVITQNHSAWLIQRFVRKLGLLNRSKMFIQFVSYIKKQLNSAELIMSMKNVYGLQKYWERVRRSVNFCFPDQRRLFGIDAISQQLYLAKDLNAPFPKHIRDCVQIQVKQQQHDNYLIANPLDLIFKGAKAIKYFSLSHQQTQSSVSRVLLSSNQSKIQLNKNSKVTVLKATNKTQQDKDKEKTMEKLAQSKLQASNSFAIIQFKNTQEAINRKFALALITYQFSTHSFVKSYKNDQNEQNKKNIINLNEGISECIILSTSKDMVGYRNIKNICSWQQKQMRLKLFVNHFDYTKKVLLLYPLENSVQENGKLMANESFKSQLNNNLISYRLKRESLKLANSNALSNPAKLNYDLTEPARKIITYKQFETNFNIKYKNRYQNANEDDKEVSHYQTNLVPKFQKYNVQDTSHNQSLLHVSQRSLARLKLRLTDRSESNLKQQMSQNKKKQIQDLKKSHKLKLEQNQYFRKQQLTKIREKANDQQQSNRKSMEENKMENALSNLRKHNNVKIALRRKSQQDEKFQASFITKGNYSIKKQLYKFQNERSIKVKDILSPNYSSIRSLANGSIKQRNSVSMIQNQNKTLNLKTQIKQFSIKGSDYDHDISSMVMNSREQQLNTKNSEDQFEQYERNANGKNYKKNQQLKKSRESVGKNKPIHSVFTQQFYPISQKDKVGFELPKINKK